MAVDYVEKLVKYGRRKDHDTFADLYPSQKKEILEEVVKALPWPAQLETFTPAPPFNRTYAVVRLNDREEYVTYLVTFGSKGAFFDNGHYGFKNTESSNTAFNDAINDMFKRAWS